jgi:bifunctional non-homologous end joining protein LigD
MYIVRKDGTEITTFPKGCIKMKMPINIVPMAASLAKEPFNDVHWCFEIKLDGFRMLAYIQDGTVKLQTRNLKDYTGKFTQITNALHKWKRSAVIDGEVVMLNDKGHSDFNALQNWCSDADGPLYYFVFDLLWLDGKDYMKERLYRRKSVLKNLLPRSPVVLYQSEIMTHGIAAYKMAQGEGLEGVVAKRIDSIYRPGVRTKDWLKLKVYQEDDFIIAGYTKISDSASPFSTLILGAYHDGQLQYAGEAGTGFSNQLIREIASELKRGKCPFPKVPRLNNRWKKNKSYEIIWCRPLLVCTVKYLEFTRDGELRHSSFQRLRPDKSPAEVIH